MEMQQRTGEVVTVWPPAVRIQGMDTAQAGVALAWSRAAAGYGQGGDRVAAARAAAWAVSRVSGCAENAVALSHRTGAAPVPMRRLAGTAEPLDCVVSIAHASGRAVAAAAATSARRLGVDLERAGAATPQQLRMFASPTERALGLDPTLLWTLKEAAWKAFSLDAATPFQALSVAAAAASRLPSYVVFALRDDIRPAAAHVWHPWPGWLAALVVVA